MGQEGERGEYGLCNAVLVSKPQSRFALRWIAMFNEVFDARIWSMHSVKYPMFAAALWPSDLTVSLTIVLSVCFLHSMFNRYSEGRPFFGPCGMSCSTYSKATANNGRTISGCICGRASHGRDI